MAAILLAVLSGAVGVFFAAGFFSMAAAFSTVFKAADVVLAAAFTADFLAAVFLTGAVLATTGVAALAVRRVFGGVAMALNEVQGWTAELPS
ncbi:hypothetical protein [Paucibacter sp. PLA-PC-4]|uniref:hypothetical protein n=1 Tax=Paucibacter sp. PLA-PC-4 TaxID=2993655 RepID=UPI002248F9D4|nr:hypothetical protein [Paucibacter sp. PLA-PC-4]